MTNALGRCALICQVAFSVLLASVAATAGPVVADTRDTYTLFKQRLLNRELFEQLDEPGQEYRIGKDWDTVAYAVDADVASVQTLSGDGFTRFHGYFVFDNFASLRAASGFDINLNLTLFNPSSSDGVRVSSYAVPSGALHFHHEYTLGGVPMRVDALGIDLGMTTLGRGLILENWPIEGAFGNLAIGDFYIRHYFAGRVFWPNDDVFTLQAGAFDGKIEAMALGWKFRDGPPISWYLDVSGYVPLFDDKVRLGAEYATNLRTEPRHGLLTRADYLDRSGLFSWHLGYQFRWYQQGFGPLRAMEAPTTTFNLPFRAEGYATNSFSYFGIAEEFEQWSHSVMAETEVPLGPFRAFGEVEGMARFVADRESPIRVVAAPGGDLVPGTLLDVYYRSGLRYYPWTGAPHRLSMVFANKQVESP